MSEQNREMLIYFTGTVVTVKLPTPKCEEQMTRMLTDAVEAVLAGRNCVVRTASGDNAREHLLLTPATFIGFRVNDCQVTPYERHLKQLEEHSRSMMESVVQNNREQAAYVRKRRKDEGLSEPWQSEDEEDDPSA